MFGAKHVSKFRHLSGKPRKREHCFDQLKLRVQGSDPPTFTVSGKFMAAIASSSNADIVVRSLDNPGRIGVEGMGIKGPNTMPQCMTWSNRDDSLLAVGFADGRVGLYRIPEGGPTQVIDTPELEFDASCGTGIGVIDIVWHPTVANMILTNVATKFGGASDTVMALWNVDTGSETAVQSPLTTIQLPGCFLVCASFNYNGSRLVCTDNNFVTRVIDVRAGTVLQHAKCHEKNRRQSSIYLKDGMIFTVGFNSSGRAYAVWSEDDLTTPLTLVELDNATGVLFPIYDPDLNIVYIWGKGDSTIFFVEITARDNGPPFLHYLNDFQTKVPQKGICALPKRHVDVQSNEVMRFFKSESSKDFVEVIPFVCPRREPGFSLTVYPNTASIEPALTQAEWLSGMDADPVLVSMNDGSTATQTPAATAGPGPVVSSNQTTPVRPVVKATTTPATPATHLTNTGNAGLAESPLFKKYEKDSKTLGEVRLIVEKLHQSETADAKCVMNQLAKLLGIPTMHSAIESGDAKKAAGSLEEAGLMNAVDQYLQRKTSVTGSDGDKPDENEDEDEADWQN